MSAPVCLADLVRAGMPDLLDRYGTKLTAGQRHGLSSMAHCRDGAFGASEMSCADCGHQLLRMRSCGHRSCPQCQHHTAQAWLQRQQARLLPVNYFLATFTLPAELRPVAYRYPRQVYPAFFAAVAQTLKRFGKNHPKLHADLGFCAVLHTHSRRLDYHPHLHVVIPGGGVDVRNRRTRLWRTLDGNYLFNGLALAKVFRAKCLAALNKAGVALPTQLPRKWVVHCKHVGNGLPALKYLSRYLYRGVIAERDLIRFDRQRQLLTFRYRHARTGSYQHRTLPLADFLWRIALHILPKGMQRVRNFGFLHGNAKRLLQLVQRVLRTVLPPPQPNTLKPFHCARCGSEMDLGRFIPAPLPSG